MKINFQHPVTKKTSSVILPDVWLRPYFLAISFEPGSFDSFAKLVASFADDYYLHFEIACRRVGFVPSMFTHYCEACLANAVTSRLEELTRPLGQSPVAFNRDTEQRESVFRNGK
jgi:hypothetical protein